MNPLLLLDEIDKLGNDYRGDPASALLEVLDSEQNSAFRDHFLEIPVDLSKVMFITTANTTETIPRPLLDRMEIIQLNSYTDEEKLQIAKRPLFPKQLAEHGLKKGSVRMSDDVYRAPGNPVCACWSGGWLPSAARRICACWRELSSASPLQRRTCPSSWTASPSPRPYTRTGRRSAW